jgi:DNA-binding FadR family transcriptional regulator
VIDPTRGPLYRQIADELHAEITRGERPPGSRFPSAEDLAQRFGVNRHTAREAMHLLARRGMLVIRHGFATRVRDTQHVAVHDVSPGHRIGARLPTDEERLELGIPEGVWVLVLYEVVTREGGEDLVPVEVWPADRTQLST